MGVSFYYYTPRLSSRTQSFKKDAPCLEGILILVLPSEYARDAPVRKWREGLFDIALVRGRASLVRNITKSPSPTLLRIDTLSSFNTFMLCLRSDIVQKFGVDLPIYPNPVENHRQRVKRASAHSSMHCYYINVLKYSIVLSKPSSS